MSIYRDSKHNAIRSIMASPLFLAYSKTGRRRDSRGRYMSTDYPRGDYRYDDRYPRHGERDAMMSKLGRMVDDAQDEQTRRVLRDTMRALGE